MFGRNACLKIDHHNLVNLKVHSIFSTFQGEGPYAGKPAIFIRLSGCNLACKFCDTEFDDFELMSVTHILRTIDKLSDSPNLIVITGGEPLRQNITFLTAQLLKRKITVQIETNGTISSNIPLNCQLVCSPKNTSGKYAMLSPKILPHITALKFLISADIDGYKDIYDVGQSKFNIPVYVQPMDQYNPQKNKNNINQTVKIARKHNAFISLQIHKLLNIA